MCLVIFGVCQHTKYFQCAMSNFQQVTKPRIDFTHWQILNKLSFHTLSRNKRFVLDEMTS